MPLSEHLFFIAAILACAFISYLANFTDYAKKQYEAAKKWEWWTPMGGLAALGERFFILYIQISWPLVMGILMVWYAVLLIKS
jgi:hypothetical protein